MPRVLVVEDNHAERRMLADLLYYNGFDVIEADDAILGMELARYESPDVILMDVRLPTMNGLIATEILQAVPETASIPVVCVTGVNVSPETVRAAGCRALLRKPMPNQELIRTVRRCLEPGPKAEAPAPPPTLEPEA
jgi:two-component system, cell cycle response regulator DivK